MTFVPLSADRATLGIMPERLDAYRMYMLGEHTHTWGSWYLDVIGEVEVCDCGQTRVPRPRDEHDTLTAGN